MKTQTQTIINDFQKNFLTLLEHSGRILKLTPEEIIEMYPDRPLGNFKFPRKTEEILKIEFMNEGATLSCDFDKWGFCIAVCIFLDFYIEVERYKDFFNRRFKYNRVLKRWRTRNCYICIVPSYDKFYYLKVF